MTGVPAWAGIERQIEREIMTEKGKVKKVFYTEQERADEINRLQRRIERADQLGYDFAVARARMVVQRESLKEGLSENFTEKPRVEAEYPELEPGQSEGGQSDTQPTSEPGHSEGGQSDTQPTSDPCQSDMVASSIFPEFMLPDFLEDELKWILMDPNMAFGPTKPGEIDWFNGYIRALIEAGQVERCELTGQNKRHFVQLYRLQSVTAPGD